MYVMCAVWVPKPLCLEPIFIVSASDLLNGVNMGEGDGPLVGISDSVSVGSGLFGSLSKFSSSIQNGKCALVSTKGVSTIFLSSLLKGLLYLMQNAVLLSRVLSCGDSKGLIFYGLYWMSVCVHWWLLRLPLFNGSFLIDGDTYCWLS